VDVLFDPLSSRNAHHRRNPTATTAVTIDAETVTVRRFLATGQLPGTGAAFGCVATPVSAPGTGTSASASAAKRGDARSSRLSAATATP
jgi:hypothetical protein